MQNILKKEYLLLKSAKNNEKSFNAFYNYFFPIIYGYILLRCQFNHKLTEDLTQDFFIKLLNKIDYLKFENDKGVKPYLFTMARNMINDHYRQTSKQQIVELDPSDNYQSQNDEQEQILKNIIKSEDEQQLLSLIKQLPNDEKKIINLKFMIGMKNKDIACELEISENAVAVQTHRVIKKLKEEFNQLASEKQAKVNI